MKKEELKKILRNHELWTEDAGGERADLRDVDLSESDLTGANLSEADLSDVITNEHTTGYHLQCLGEEK